MNKEFQICKRCVMDTSDPKISFNEEGICDHCISYDKNVKPNWHPNQYGMELFKKKVKQIQKIGLEFSIKR